MSSLPQRQRVAAYAVILRDNRILLSRLSPAVTRDELWTLPGGGLDHGEDPRNAVVREVYEETGLHAEVGELARVYSAHLPGVWREGKRVDAHALRIVSDGWVPLDSPEPSVPTQCPGDKLACAPTVMAFRTLRTPTTLDEPGGQEAATDSPGPQATSCWAATASRMTRNLFIRRCASRPSATSLVAARRTCT